jgi:ABC-2 type transport system ATP-binding protein
MASVEELCDHIALINKSVKILDGKMNEIKKAYKSNTFEIDFDGFSGDIRSVLPADYELLEKSLKDGHQKVKIRIPAGTSPNALLETLLPHISIAGFHEILPSMNDIFISKVNET